MSVLSQSDTLYATLFARELPANRNAPTSSELK